jgi:hypothetical protein
MFFVQRTQNKTCKTRLTMLSTRITYNSAEIQTLQGRYHFIFAMEVNCKRIYKSHKKDCCVLESQVYTDNLWRGKGWAILQCLTPVLECIGIVFFLSIVVVCLIHVLLSETNITEEGTEKVFDKSLGRVNDNFLNAFRNILSLTVDWFCTVRSHYYYSNIIITRVRIYSWKVGKLACIGWVSFREVVFKSLKL